jgi:hypothetical protein
MTWRPVRRAFGRPSNGALDPAAPTRTGAARGRPAAVVL